LKGESNSEILSGLPEFYFLSEYKNNEFLDESNGTKLLEEEL